MNNKGVIKHIESIDVDDKTLNNPQLNLKLLFFSQTKLIKWFCDMGHMSLVSDVIQN